MCKVKIKKKIMACGKNKKKVVQVEDSVIFVLALLFNIRIVSII